MHKINFYCITYNWEQQWGYESFVHQFLRKKNFRSCNGICLSSFNHIYIWQVSPLSNMYSIANACINNAEKMESSGTEEIGL